MDSVNGAYGAVNGCIAYVGRYRQERADCCARHKYKATRGIVNLTTNDAFVCIRIREDWRRLACVTRDTHTVVGKWIEIDRIPLSPEKNIVELSSCCFLNAFNDALSILTAVSNVIFSNGIKTSLTVRHIISYSWRCFDIICMQIKPWSNANCRNIYPLVGLI